MKHSKVDMSRRIQKYIRNECSPAETEALMHYFADENSKADLKEAIRTELQNDAGDNSLPLEKDKFRHLFVGISDVIVRKEVSGAAVRFSV